MVAGNYKAQGNIMGSVMETDITYEVNGDVLTGTKLVWKEIVAVEEGIVEGNHFKYICHVTTLMGKLKVKVEGDVIGDEITFTLKSAIGNSKFKGTRV